MRIKMTNEEMNKLQDVMEMLESITNRMVNNDDDTLDDMERLLVNSLRIACVDALDTHEYNKNI